MLTFGTSRSIDSPPSNEHDGNLSNYLVQSEMKGPCLVATQSRHNATWYALGKALLDTRIHGADFTFSLFRPPSFNW